MPMSTPPPLLLGVVRAPQGFLPAAAAAAADTGLPPAASTPPAGMGCGLMLWPVMVRSGVLHTAAVLLLLLLVAGAGVVISLGSGVGLRLRICVCGGVVRVSEGV